MLSEGDDRTTASKRVIAAAGGAEALRLATAWGRSSDPDRRGAALDLLIALRDSAFDSDVDPDPEIIRMLFEQAGAVTADDDEYLRWRAARALALVGMGGAPAVRHKAVESLMRFADDEDDDVRHQVAYGLSLVTPEDAAPEDPSVVVLVRLLGDPDPDVQDYASFAFTIRTVDSPTIRDALLVLSATSVEPAAG